MVGKGIWSWSVFLTVLILIGGCRSNARPHARGFGSYLGDVEPQTYTAPSGHFSLWINPSNPHGTGAAEYRLAKDGQLLWNRVYDFTLLDAAVDDLGRIGGCTNTRVVDDEGYLEVVILDPGGRLVEDDRHPLHQSTVVDGSPEPYAEGVLMDGANGRLVVRVAPPANEEGEEWWTYDLKSGNSGETLRPLGGAKDVLCMVEAKPLNGTPLILIHWRTIDTGGYGATYTLVDQEANPLWRLDLPGDYDSPPPSPPRAITTGLDDENSILAAGPGGRFELKFAKAKERVAFQASQNDKKWRVSEVARSPYVSIIPPKPHPVSIPKTSLNLFRKWVVPESGGDIKDLSVEPDGTVVVLEGATGEVRFFDARGKLIHLGKPLPTDYTENPPLARSLQITKSGDVYAECGAEAELRYSASGQRIAKVPWIRDLAPATIQAPKPTWRWVLDRLVDENGHSRGQLERWPDQFWLEYGPDAVAPDGSLMAIGTKERKLYGTPPDRIAFYSPSGVPESMSTLPPGIGAVDTSAYDGKAAYLVIGDHITAIGKTGKPEWRFAPLLPNKGHWQIFPSLGGIAVWDGKSTVYWYKTP